ncbi:MAG: UbiA family prenyltransferase [Gemmataceae bacterium]|nr:UbiA family prenyltransferase [Gemmataceae bacterium]
MATIHQPEGTLSVTSPAQSAGAAAPRSALDLILPYLSIARPDHWFKNVFMLAGVLLAYFCYPEPLQADKILPFFAALAATCLLASSNYVINEILDAPYDRSHPSKRFRPIPSGRVWLPIAYAEWLLLAAAGLLIALSVNWPFFWSGVFLLVMGLVYNVPPIRSKELPYIDVLSESINNPIRLMLGWFVVNAHVFPPVSLLIAYWMIGAFFMAAKRLAEYRSIGDRAVAGAYRGSFRHYDQEKLLISMFGYTTSFALFLGVFIIRYHLELILIFPLLAGFMCYYLYVSFKQGSAAQSPEKLYREKGLMIYLVLCLAVFFVLMFTNIPVLYEWFNVPPSPVAPLWKF